MSFQLNQTYFVGNHDLSDNNNIEIEDSEIIIEISDSTINKIEGNICLITRIFNVGSEDIFDINEEGY